MDAGTANWNRQPFAIESWTEQSPSTLFTAAPAWQSSTSILFIDERVENYQQLVSGVQAGTEVHLISKREDAIATITQTLLGRSNIGSVHLVSHGQSGSLQLGASDINDNTLDRSSALLMQWASALTADADILLYGCDIAQGDRGQAFLQRFSQLTGADVAASNNLTGSATLGGDWTLEINTGEISSAIAFSTETIAAYHSTLPVDLISEASTLGGNSSASGSFGRSSTNVDGRYTVFTSDSPDLVGNDTNGKSDVFLYDRNNNSVTLISHASTSQTAVSNGTSSEAVISSNGDFVAFLSTATNLVTGGISNPNNATNVYLWERSTGQITLVSKALDNQAGLETSKDISISNDGRSIAFTTLSDLDTNQDTNQLNDVYYWLKNPTGAGGTLQLVSLGWDGSSSSRGADGATISGDGSAIVFKSSSDNLVSTDTSRSEDIFLWRASDRLITAITSNKGTSLAPIVSFDGRRVGFVARQGIDPIDTNAKSDVYVWTRNIADDEGTTQLVSVNASGTGAGNVPSSFNVNNSNLSINPVFDITGNKIAFSSESSDLVANDTNGKRDIFLRDLTTNTTTLVSQTDSGSASDGDSDLPSINFAGDRIAFISSATNLVTTDSNGKKDIFLRDLGTARTTLISRTIDGTAGNDASGAPVGTRNSDTQPMISNDGNFVVFSSLASDLVGGDNNNQVDIFVTPAGVGNVKLVTGIPSTGASSRTGNGDSNTIARTAVSDDGRYVLFVSQSPTLVANDTNNAQDVFLRDLQTNTTRLISRTAANTSGNAASGNAQLSANGQFIVFSSTASNLVNGDANNTSDVFWVDVVNTRLVLVSHAIASTNSGNGSSINPVISADGRYVAFASTASDLVNGDTNTKQDIFVWDSQDPNGTLTLVSHTATHNGGNADADTPAISGDGRYVTFVSSASDLVGTPTNGKQQVYVWDRQDNSVKLVSQNASGDAGDNDSSAPTISRTTGRIAFASFATNLGDGTDSNNGQDIFVRDLIAGTTSLVSKTASGNTYSVGGSLGGVGQFEGAFNPIISGDGSTVAFSSTFKNLVSQDTNTDSDIFVRDLTTNTTQLISISPAGSSGTGSSDGVAGVGSGSFDPVLSVNGRFVAFTSYSNNLVGTDGNGKTDVFVRDRRTHSTLLISQTATGNSANDLSSNPAISGDGGYIAFTSKASDLVDGDRNSKSDVFGFSRQPTVSLTTIKNLTKEEDGQNAFVTFELRRSNTLGGLIVKLAIDPTSQATITANANTPADFTATVNGGATLTIEGNELTIEIPDGVELINLILTAQEDAQAEGNEVIKFDIVADSSYLISSSTANATIAASDTTVTNTHDTGEGSLRQAILNANATPGQDTIRFQIPGTGVQTINLESALPTITESIVIDGFSQTAGATTPQIELNGAGITTIANGLNLAANNSTVKGVILNRFSGNGIRIAGTDNIIQNNYIGTDNTGANDLGNGLDGIHIEGSNNTIGGAIENGNIISGNDANGIAVTNTDAQSATVVNNRIQGNRIFANTKLGIDLGDDGATANDAGDLDTGANQLQNTIVLTTIEPGANGTLIGGLFTGSANATYELELFGNTGTDPEGGVPFAKTSFTTDANGNYTLSYNYTGTTPIGTAVSATVTDANGNTSEFSNAQLPGIPKVTIDPVSVSLNEGGWNALTDFVFAVQLDRASGQTVSVIANTSDNVITGTDDYIALTNQIVTFNAGETQTFVTVKVKGDTVQEALESFNLTLSAPTNAELGSAIVATGFITNDDVPPEVSITALTPSANEGDLDAQNDAVLTPYLFEVALNNPSSEAITVNYATEDGSATAADGDYTAIAATPLNFAIGETRKTITVFAKGDTKFEQNELFSVKLSSPSNNVTLGTAIATSTISNDDTGSTISISTVPQVNEGNSGTTDYVFTVTLDKPSGEPVTVSYTTADGSAMVSDNDYVNASGNVTFTPNTTLQLITVKVTGDTKFEGDETFSIALTNPLNGAVSTTQGSAIATIKNDDAVPTVSISGPSPVLEGDAIGQPTGKATFIVSLSDVSTQVATVEYTTTDGSAIAGQDFTAQTNTLTFNPGETSKTITIDVLGDTQFEGNETFSVTLSNPSGASLIGGTPSASATITDDDGVPSLSIVNTTPIAQTEGNSSTTAQTFEVSLSNASSQTIGVQYQTVNGTALAGSDFEALLNTLTFNPGETRKTITVNVTGDTNREPDELFSVQLTSLTTSATIATGTATATIRNDDNVPIVSITDVSQTEGNAGQTPYVFNVSLGSASSDTISVVYNTEDGSATAGTDYIGISNQTLTFAPGETSKSITVFAIGDTTLEPDEAFKLTLSNPSNAMFSTTGTPTLNATGTIRNDDRRPKLGIDGFSAGEGNSGTIDRRFTVTLSNGSVEEIRVNYTTQDGSATVADGDYTAKSGTLVFAPGGPLSQTITVQTQGDTQFEDTEQFTLNLIPASVVNADIDVAQATGILSNDDGQPTLSMSGRQSLNEGNSGNTPFTYTVSLSNASSSPVSVVYNTIAGTPGPTTATPGTDYTPISGTLTFNPGEVQKTLTVNAIGDTTLEDSESFTLRLSDPTGAILPATNTDAEGIILNDDQAIRPLISIDDASAIEGNTGDTNPLRFIVRLSSATTNTVSVTYATTDGSATAIDNDYTALPLSTLTFNPGETAKTITVFAKGDTKFEGSEAFNLRLSSPINADLSSTTPAQGTITNDDARPTLSVNTKADREENTGVKEFVFAVDLSNPTADTVTVDYTTVDGNGTGGAMVSDGDYQATSGSLTFTPGGPLQQFVTVRVNGDRKFEPSETFTLQLRNPQNATLSTLTGQGVGTILGDDFPPTITIVSEAQNNTRIEGDPLTFRVELSNPSSETVTVNYQAKDGSATQGSDFTATSGSITFLPNELIKTLTIQTIGDTQYERDEAFSVELSNAVNGILSGTVSAGGIIRNNDPLPQLRTTAPTAQNEGNSGTTAYTFQVSLSQASPDIVTVNYSAIDGSAALSNGDYTATQGTLTFNPGELTKTVTITAIGDTRSEPDETFQLQLSGPTNATIATGSDFTTATILNDDLVGNLQINRDNRFDLIWQNKRTGEDTLWLLNNTTYDQTVFPFTVAERVWDVIGSGDFNADGTDDLLWRNMVTGDTYLWYMENNAFKSLFSLGMVNPGWDMVGVGDFNRDRKSDILWRSRTTGQNVVWIMEGGTRRELVYLDAVTDLGWKIQAIGDYDNDGDTDILWRHSNTGYTVWWQMHNTQLETFLPLHHVTDLAWQIQGVGDFTGDTFLDILWHHTTTEATVLWEMRAATPIQGIILPQLDGRGWNAKQVTDFDKDGNIDIFWRNDLTGENLIWYMNRSLYGGGVYLPSISDLNWKTTRVGNFDGKGTPEMMWLNSVAGESLTWTFNPNLYNRTIPTGTIGSTRFLPNPLDRNWVIDTSGDFDRDGEADLVWHNTRTGDYTIVLMRNGSAYRQALTQNLGHANWFAEGTGDLDGDGDLDLVWRNYDTGLNYAWIMDGATFSRAVDLGSVTDRDWKIEQLADFNRDGKADILWQNYRTGSAAIWLTNLPGLFTIKLLEPVDRTWKIRGVADFNGDRNLDIVWHNETNGGTVVWQMNSANFVSYTWLPTVSTAWDIAGVRDFSGDGLPDLLWRNRQTGENTLWYLNGTQIGLLVYLPTWANLDWEFVGINDFKGND